ncbi:MAG: YcjF family protein [Paracoccaceae bacterium]
MSDSKDPVLIELDEEQPIGPDTAPPVPDESEAPTGRAMQTVVRIGARRPSRLGRWFWRLLAALVTFALSLWAWNFVTALIARNTYLGYAAFALVAAFLLVCLGLILREWSGISRLRRIDAVHHAAEAAIGAGDLAAARIVTDRLASLYTGRAELEWGRARMIERQDDVFDADAQIGLAEVELLAGLDARARAQVETAARQVALVTAIVPLALADVAAALVANLRMIRRIAEIYGGRAGTLGSWRLTRTVLTHLAATGALAIGDDLIGTIAGGGVLSKLSRRFGEGIINGALTARVGVAAMEVCRPLPFRALKRPSVTGMVKRALAGLFSAK